MGKFANKPSAKTSKRQPANKKYKIKKKVKEHKKKLKKEVRKMKALGMIKKKSPKDVDLPNLYPFKKQVLESMRRKDVGKQKNLKKFEEREKQGQEGQIDLDLADVRSNMYEADQVVIQQKTVDNQQQSNRGGKNDAKKYISQVKAVIQASDIILEVLDARDPMACRCKELEREILGMAGEKKIILILNKIDLIPPGNADAWLKHLRREFATIVFKANTQNQHSNLAQASIYKKTLTQRQDLADDLTSSSKGIGADKLLELIKNYSKNEGVTGSVTVGVIGYPNVGKSSVINSLKRSKACGVSSTPGFTKGLQEVIIDSQVKIVDCPGVLFDSNNQSSTLLRNILKIEQLEDYREPVKEILQRVNKNELILLYKIANFVDDTEFLVQVALSRGKLQKGGAPDLDVAARLVLQDWNSGRIKYFTIPPEPINSMDQE